MFLGIGVNLRFKLFPIEYRYFHLLFAHLQKLWSPYTHVTRQLSSINLHVTAFLLVLFEYLLYTCLPSNTPLQEIQKIIFSPFINTSPRGLS